MANFTIVHITHPMFFPTLFAVTSLGICNFAARFLVIFAPLIAEVAYPFPLVLITVLQVAAGVSALFLIEPNESKDKAKSKLDLSIKSKEEEDSGKEKTE